MFKCVSSSTLALVGWVCDVRRRGVRGGSVGDLQVRVVGFEVVDVQGILRCLCDCWL